MRGFFRPAICSQPLASVFPAHAGIVLNVITKIFADASLPRERGDLSKNWCWFSFAGLVFPA